MAPRAALVTGGSSGIGNALARVLGQEGYAVTISGRDEGKLAAAAEELDAEGIAVRTAAGDVADEDAVARIVAAHETVHGRMDALVNAAAYGCGGVPLAHLSTEMLDRHLDVDLRAMFLTIRVSLPRRWCSPPTSGRGCGSCCARRRRASCARSSSRRPRSARSSSASWRIAPARPPLTSQAD